ncbi:hypothetical protein M3Y95_00377000 [Aphelenchoides besseyi]|nr:hypothetical protein M3Y95_00377000 [Aphelenchoides besseyi]
MLWNLFLIFLSIFGTKVVSNDELESNAVNCTGRRTCKAVLPTLIKISSRNTTVSTTYLNRYYSRLNESEKYRFDGYNRHIQIVIWNPKNDSNFRTTAQKLDMIARTLSSSTNYAPRKTMLYNAVISPCNETVRWYIQCVNKLYNKNYTT